MSDQPTDHTERERAGHKELTDILLRVKDGTLGVLSAEDEITRLRAMSEWERYTLEEFYDAYC